MPHFRPATEEDCRTVAPLLRTADRAECEALGSTPLQGLLGGLKASPLCRSLVDDEGRPFAIYGACPLPMKGVGSPWMLGTDGVRDNWVWFLRNSAYMVETAHGHFPILFNVVDVRNTVHVRWLRWCGFTFGAVTALGPHNLPFQEFTRKRDV